MFRHETAPLCMELGKCTFRKCQLSHTVNDGNNQHIGESDDEDEKVYVNHSNVIQFDTFNAMKHIF